MKAVHRLTVCACFFMFITGIYSFAQSNDRIDELLAQGQARFDSAAYIILAAGGLVEETDGLDVAFSKAVELGFTGKLTTPESPVRVDEMSFMIMKSLSLKGGFMYRLFPGKRYSYRELAFNKVINDKGGPRRLVSGEEVVRSLGNAFAFKGGN